MDVHEVTKHLATLLQIDLEAVQAYEQAMDAVETDTVRRQLESFRTDHQRSAADLATVIRSLGDTPPATVRDEHGDVYGGITAEFGLPGTEVALKALRDNEQVMHQSYGEVLAMDLPADVKERVARNYQDQQRHIQYFDETLQQRTWERERRLH